MAYPRQIANITSHVYGPYPEDIILKDNYPRAGVTLAIRELQMYRDNRPVGFDDTELIGNPPAGSVVFFGVFEISSLDCLSELGLKFLQEDLRKYDEKIHLAHAVSGLTLGALYGHRKGEGSRIKVRIQCRKVLLANFLTTNTDPEKLIIYSEFADRSRRRFWVQSLHVSTYRSSRNFFDRYRLRALIEDLIRTDRQKTPLEGRNIDWLVRQYLETIHPRDKDNRIIYDPPPDIDASSEPRHLRHLPHAAVRGYFASHAEWLLAHQIASASKSVKLLDIPQWIHFCREVRQDALEAKKNGVRWGLPHGEESELTGPHNLARSLARFGFDAKYWAKRLKIAHKNQENSKKAGKARPSPEIDQREDIAATGSGWNMQYDSDFSEASTPEATDSEGDVPTFPTSRIPAFCFQQPQLPSGRFTWHCPGCHYSINLLDLSPSDLDVVPMELKRGLLTQNWTMNESNVREALNLMVSYHYEKNHLAASGVTFEPSHNGKWRAVDTRLPNTSLTLKTVKVEHSDSNLSVLRRSSRKPRPRRLGD
ncbi:unnamed protein product [Cyclocybe aegerita]|uniref:Uncharacterized protein n=1 Tax=Cyclocybe aegerita TaxID=1973307 RepID=A0A8S0W2Q7_CYCAE|nr:unnamed protein product [Cyclocybe aegerita]